MGKTGNAERVGAGKLQILKASDIGLADDKRRSVSKGFSVAVRVLMQNWRQGTVACLGRSDVNRSRKKPWKQKGTGRARVGSARSPLWRGGGVIFGPQARTRTLSISRKCKQLVLRNIFMDKLDRGNILVADWAVSGQKPSTAQAYGLLKELNLHAKKIAVCLPWSDAITRASFNNISNVRVLLFDQFNAFDLANESKILLLQKDFEQFKKTVEARWS